ncbi:MAG: M23 family metallopeptidase [Actinomycetes bacterium]
MAATLGVALACGSAAVAAASPLSDRHEDLQRSISVARDEVDQGSAALDAATAALQASQQQLEAARAALERSRKALAAARVLDEEIAAQLVRERDLLDRAKRATARARADVEAQQAKIAQAAREAYQGRSDLVGIGVVLGGRSASEMGQRLQWDTTIFHTTAHRLAELTVLEERLAAAEQAQADAEARVAAEKERSARNIARMVALEAEASAEERDVAALTSRNEQDRAEAQAALDADNREYEALLAEEAAVEAEIAARVAQQLANGVPREDIARLIAQGIVSTNPATYPLAETGAQMMLSPRGLIRPVKARPGSSFGRRFHPILKHWRNHNGTDFGARCGTPLYAAQSGTVVQARSQGGFGNYTIVDHGIIGGKSVMTGYAHMESMAVRAGQRVRLGQAIGTVGTTGLSTGCHLHLQVYVNGRPVDPMTWVP